MGWETAWRISPRPSSCTMATRKTRRQRVDFFRREGFAACDGKRSSTSTFLSLSIPTQSHLAKHLRQHERWYSETSHFSSFKNKSFYNPRMNVPQRTEKEREKSPKSRWFNFLNLKINNNFNFTESSVYRNHLNRFTLLIPTFSIQFLHPISIYSVCWSCPKESQWTGDTNWTLYEEKKTNKNNSWDRSEKDKITLTQTSLWSYLSLIPS